MLRQSSWWFHSWFYHPHPPHPQPSSPDSKVHGANMGPTWVLSAPYGHHVGPTNLALWDLLIILTKPAGHIYHGYDCYLECRPLYDLVPYWRPRLILLDFLQTWRWYEYGLHTLSALLYFVMKTYLSLTALSFSGATQNGMGKLRVLNHRIWQNNATTAKGRANKTACIFYRLYCKMIQAVVPHKYYTIVHRNMSQAGKQSVRYLWNRERERSR